VPSTIVFATTTPVWVAILLAVLTGLFGLLSGAAAATAITTSHETREQFRDRMIVAADHFIAAETEARRAVAAFYQKFIDELARVTDATNADGAAIYTAEDWVRVNEGISEEQTAADLATRKLAELIPRLWVVFRSSEPATLATAIKDEYGVADFHLRRAIRHWTDEASNNDTMVLDYGLFTQVTNGLRPLAETGGSDQLAPLLRAFNREIRKRWRL
jgi:hypothetical protein